MRSYRCLGGEPGAMLVAEDERPRFPLVERWRWKEPGGNFPDNALKEDDSLLVTDGAYGERHCTVYCLDARTGSLRWQHTAERPGHADVACVIGGLVFFRRSDAEDEPFRAHRIADGSLAWENNALRPSSGAYVVIGSRFVTVNWNEGTREICLIESADGSVLWRRRYDAVLWPQAAGTSFLLLDTEGDRGALSCVSLLDGSPLWQKHYGEVGHHFDPIHKRSELGSIDRVTAAGDRIYCVVQRFHVLCLDAATGDMLWHRQFEKGAGQQPIVADRRVYFCNGYDFFCLDAATGDDVFEPAPLRDFGFLGGRGFLAGHYYLSAGNGRLFAVDVRDGVVVWQHANDSFVFFPPFFSDGCLYVSCSDGHVYCFAPAPGATDRPPRLADSRPAAPPPSPSPAPEPAAPVRDTEQPAGEPPVAEEIVLPPPPAVRAVDAVLFGGYGVLALARLAMGPVTLASGLQALAVLGIAVLGYRYSASGRLWRAIGILAFLVGWFWMPVVGLVGLWSARFCLYGRYRRARAARWIGKVN